MELSLEKSSKIANLQDRGFGISDTPIEVNL